MKNVEEHIDTLIRYTDYLAKSIDIIVELLDDEQKQLFHLKHDEIKIKYKIK